ncbi:putative methyltransferase-domain-containing protein [Thamnocephalis sphaerospora]|uniref:Putative methyltransferase-domain-containing protein n=1 Tax=Thamnocephalis sphaerospora TaxID=78915 RepID=A0A4P9XXD1_9FUNG|nr:putative methyltransferase-domain-containing protein [Thamnocephalis sphaerospora]|eukprot:RKP11026.1 putative methyltransferase-domain-containing protein [Thamnocephalis sphaerospora]
MYESATENAATGDAQPQAGLNAAALRAISEISCLPVLDCDEEVFLLFTERSGAGWEHNRDVNQKAAILELEINDIAQRRVHQLSFHQNRGLLGARGTTGSVVWDSSICLARFLAQHAAHALPLQGRRCIELGSGCGVGGVACAQLGAHVCLTDQETLLPLIRKNVQENGLPLHDSVSEWQVTHLESSTPTVHTKARRRRGDLARNPPPRQGPAKAAAVMGSVCVTELMWGEPLAHYLPVSNDDAADHDDAATKNLRWDYIIASDCAYNEHIVPAFVNTLATLAGETTLVVLAQELRSDLVHACLLEHLLQTFNVWRVLQDADASDGQEADGARRSCVVLYLAVLRVVV